MSAFGHMDHSPAAQASRKTASRDDLTGSRPVFGPEIPFAASVEPCMLPGACRSGRVRAAAIFGLY